MGWADISCRAIMIVGDQGKGNDCTITAGEINQCSNNLHLAHHHESLVIVEQFRCAGQGGSIIETLIDYKLELQAS